MNEEMNEEMKVNKVEKEKLSVKEKGFLIIGGVIAITAMSASYKLGENITDFRMQRGLSACFKHDPSLETHMGKVLNEMTSKLKK